MKSFMLTSARKRTRTIERTMARTMVIVINTFGATLQYDTVSVAATKLGNLGTAANIIEIILPGCAYVDLDIDIVPDNCKMSKSRFAIYFHCSMPPGH